MLTSALQIHVILSDLDMLEVFVLTRTGLTPALVMDSSHWGTVILRNVIQVRDSTIIIFP